MWDSNSGLPDPEPAGLIFILQRVTDRESGRGISDYSGVRLGRGLMNPALSSELLLGGS